MIAPRSPITGDAHGAILSQLAVTETNPTMIPLQKVPMSYLLTKEYSLVILGLRKTQNIPEKEGAKILIIAILAAFLSLGHLISSIEPALKKIQLTHKSNVPNIIKAGL
jgi:hypothetical protein